MPAAIPIGRVPSYPTDLKGWTVFTNWLLNLVQNILASVSTGTDAAAAAAAAQTTANTAQTTGTNAQTSATAAGTAAAGAQTSANAAQATANTAETNATTALASITIINGQIVAINAILAPGITHSSPLAKLTTGGTAGSQTFILGILTAAVDPT